MSGKIITAASWSVVLLSALMLHDGTPSTRSLVVLLVNMALLAGMVTFAQLTIAAQRRHIANLESRQ